MADFAKMANTYIVKTSPPPRFCKIIRQWPPKFSDMPLSICDESRQPASMVLSLIDAQIKFHGWEEDGWERAHREVLHGYGLKRQWAYSSNY